MKRLFISLLVCGVIVLSGCVSNSHDQVLVKETIFGLDVAPGSGASSISGLTYSVKFGLIRNEYLSNPTSTNVVYAAPFQSSVNASIQPLDQTATEILSTTK